MNAWKFLWPIMLLIVHDVRIVAMRGLGWAGDRLLAAMFAALILNAFEIVFLRHRVIFSSGKHL